MESILSNNVAIVRHSVHNMLASGILVFILCIFKPVYSKCTDLTSQKYGALEVIISDELNIGCISGFLLRQKQSNRTFCLKEEGGDEIFTCTQGSDDCYCGVSNEENFDEAKNGNKIFHGEFVKKNEYPWMAAVYREKTIVCGGALITDQVVLTAAHCMTMKEKREYMVGLGMHHIKDLRKFRKDPNTFNFDGQYKGAVIRKIKDFQKHPEYNRTIRFEFAVLVLKSKVILGPHIGTVCLPNPGETFDGAENLITGFGTQMVWYQEYERLMNKKIKGTEIIPQTLRLDRDRLLEALSDKNYQKRIIDGFYKAFIEVFPGIGRCINEKFTFLCYQMGPSITNEITKLIKDKLDKNADKAEVDEFIGWTRYNIIRELGDLLENMQFIKVKPTEEIMQGSYFRDIYLNSSVPTSYKTALFEKTKDFQQEWAFIQKNVIVQKIIYQVTIPPSGYRLKRARGKFISSQDCLKIFPKAIEACSRSVDSSILVQRSIEGGFPCAGDSGGPIVVKQNGHYVLAALLSRGPYLGRYNWPPECACNCVEYPEEDGRVTAALPWLYQFLKERNLEVTCKAK